MTKGSFNIGERRGMLIVIALLAIVAILAFYMRNCNGSGSQNSSNIDSVAQQLQAQADSMTIDTADVTKEKKTRKKKKNSKPKSKPVERNPLNETLPLSN